MQRFTISEDKIDKVVKDVLNNLIPPIEQDADTLDFDTSNMSKEEIFHEIVQRTRFDNKTFQKTRLDEGLITSYDASTVARKVNQKFDVSVYVDDVGDDSVGKVDVIGVLIPSNLGKNEIGAIKHFMSSCGYFKNKKETKVNGGEFYMYVFEPTFSKNVTELVRNRCKFLYHMTPKIFLSKILKNGLTPKGNDEDTTDEYYYPDRVFLTLGNSKPSANNKELWNIRQSKNRKLKASSNPYVTDEYVLLKIDVSLLPETTTFYADPLTNNAVFTYDNIPPSSIIGIEDFTQSER